MAFTIAQPWSHSAGFSQNSIHDDDKNPQCILDSLTPSLQSTISSAGDEVGVPAPHCLPELQDYDGTRGSEDNSSDLERDLLRALNEQKPQKQQEQQCEKIVFAAATGSVNLHHCSTERIQNQETSQVLAVVIHSRSEEFRDASPIETSRESEKGYMVAQQGAEVVEEDRQHEEGEDMVGVVEGTVIQREQQQYEEDEHEDEELNEQAMEECSQTEMEEGGSNNSEDEDYSHDTGDEEDEDLRPAKRRKTPLVPSDEVPTHRYPPTSIINEQLQTPLPSRSPSAIEGLAPAAVYQEWPFEGFLKSVRIGTKTTFSLEFILDDVPEDLELSAPFEALGKNLSAKLPPKPRTSQSTMMPSKRQHRTSRLQKKRAPWTEWTMEEDGILEKMGKDGCSWEAISAAIPSHSSKSIPVRYSNKFSSGDGSRKRRRLQI
jgi:hypothetical protein